MFCVFLTRSWRKRETIAFPSNICTKNYFLKKLKRSGKNSRNFQEKTQENIQKLKQNEHQVLSCSQKKCKIKTPGLIEVVVGLLLSTSWIYRNPFHTGCLSLSLKDWGCPKSRIETFAIPAMKLKLIDFYGMLQNGDYRLLAKGMQRLKPENM